MYNGLYRNGVNPLRKGIIFIGVLFVLGVVALYAFDQSRQFTYREFIEEVLDGAEMEDVREIQIGTSSNNRETESVATIADPELIHKILTVL